jgi:parallel beta-helix repeat protein
VRELSYKILKWGNQMKRKWLAVGIILLFIGTSIIPAMAQNTEIPLPASRGNWLYVGGGGPGNFSKIQDAIDNASEGDTVFVYDDSSPYYEHLTIIKSLRITGENQDTVKIFGTGENTPLLLIRSDYTYVSNFTIGYGTEGNTGIHIKNSLHISIVHCKLSNIPSMDAVTISDSENITIAHCLMSDAFEKDEFAKSSRYISGITLEGGCANVIISDTTISNASYAGIIVLNECKNTTIINNIIFSNVFFGIEARDSDSLCIQGNTILNNRVGIAISGCSDTLISMNSCKNNGFSAIGISDTKNTYIEYNNFMKSGMSGLFGFFTFNFGEDFSIRYPNNHFEGNYWGKSRLFPKPIFGAIMYKKDTQSPTIILPWLMFDWHPAQKPYNIPGMR